MSYQRPTTYNLGPQLPQGPVFHNHHQQQQQQQQQQPHHRQADPPSSPEMSSSSASGYRLSGVRTGSSEPDTKRESSQQQQQQATSAPHTYPSTMPPPNVQQPPVPFYPYPPYTSQSHPSQPQSQRLNDGTNPQQQQFVPQPSVGGTEQHRMPGLKTESGGPPSLPVIYTQAVPMIVGTSPPSSSTTLSSALSVPSSSSADARSPADTDATSPGSALATPDSATYSLAATPGSVPRLPPILQVEKVQVTTTATQAASASRRRNEAHFVCPVPGCGSTFTRRFNLRGHLRSHTEERPYVCEWPGCGKCFARQHDCKRHQALHSQRTQANVCQGCKKTFSRLDALNRHLRSDGGVECRVVHQQAAGSSVDGNSSSAGMSGGGADSSRLALASAIPSGGPSHAQQQSADHPNQPPTA